MEAESGSQYVDRNRNKLMYSVGKSVIITDRGFIAIENIFFRKQYAKTRDFKPYDSSYRQLLRHLSMYSPMSPKYARISFPSLATV